MTECDDEEEEFQYVPGINSVSSVRESVTVVRAPPCGSNNQDDNREADVFRLPEVDENWMFTLRKGGKTFGKTIGKHWHTLAKRVKDWLTEES